MHHLRQPRSPLICCNTSPSPSMDLYYPPSQASLWSSYFTPFLFHSYYNPLTPQNHVNWTQNPDSHLFSADLPGVRKDEIRVEVEDSRYLVIRTEEDGGGAAEAAAGEEDERRRRRFMRKFRLPENVNVESISAGFEDGVLTVTVPRLVSLRRRRPAIDPVEIDRAAENNSVARAA